MRISKLLITLVSFLSITSSAYAGVLVDPYVGYSFGSSSYDTKKYDYNTAQFGARLGYQQFGFMAGLDYSLSGTTTLNVKHQAGNTTKYDITKHQFGLFVGYQLPVMFRFWGTYFLDASMKDKLNPPTTNSGKGYALGLGFTGLPFVSLNLEYRSFTYVDETQSGVTSKLNPPDWKMKEIFLSISVPLSI